VSPRWTSTELSDLRAMLATLDYGPISKLTGRSICALKNTARRYGLPKRQGGRRPGSYEVMCRKGLHALTDDNLIVRETKRSKAQGEASVRVARVERQCRSCMNLAAKKRLSTAS